MEREFVLNEKLEPRASDSMVLSASDPMPGIPTVMVTLPQKVSYNLQEIQQVVARVASRLGCSPCHSGFDLRFRQELDFAVDQNLNVRTATQGF